MSKLREGLFEGENIYDPYFTASPLTRLSFLRQSNELLDKASKHSSAQYLCMHELNPLRNKDGSLALISYDKVESIIQSPYSTSQKVQLESFNSKSRQPTLVFLGLDLETRSAGVSLTNEQIYTGIPYFALDCTFLPDSQLSDIKSHGEFTPTRVDLTLSQGQSSLYAQARSYIDWHNHNRFCSSCGSPTLATQGGTKIVCPPNDASRPDRAVKNCQTRTGLHNTAFARTDATLIAAPVSADGRRVLLGRGKRWPDKYWSALSGFIEPAESMESATRREVWEESGVKVGDVSIHSSQAWPYPSTLLVGTIGVCASKDDEVVSYPEKELGEAKWFELDEVKEALNHGHAMWEQPPKGWTGIRVPPDKLMAHRTLRGVIKLFGRR